MIKRRDFLKQAATGLASVASVPAWLGIDSTEAWASSTDTVITILHTNDTHSRIDPFPEGGGRNAGRAGAARRATLIDSIRRENPNTLLLDAGDVFQGTPYFNLYKGELDFKVMSALGYDVMTIGNHDFDAGMDGLENAMGFANFDFVSANYDFSKTNLADRIKAHTIRQIGDVRVGIFGLGVGLKGLVPDALCKDVVYLDPFEVAQQQVKYLRSEAGCDLVIGLSHLGNRGYGDQPGDQDLAQELPGCDLIVGGQSHTFMNEPTRNRHGDRETLVFQVGFAGINVGRVDFHMRAGEVVKSRAGALPVEKTQRNRWS